MVKSRIGASTLVVAALLAAVLIALLTATGTVSTPAAPGPAPRTTAL